MPMPPPPPTVRFTATPATPRLLTESHRVWVVTSRKTVYAVHRDLPSSKTCVLAFLRRADAEKVLQLLDTQQRLRRAIDGRLDASHTLTFPDDDSPRPWRPLATRALVASRLEDQCLMQFWDMWLATDERRVRDPHDAAAAVDRSLDVHVREIATLSPPSRHAAERRLERLLHQH